MAKIEQIFYYWLNLIIMKSKEIKRSTFCLFLMWTVFAVWLFVAFFVVDNVRVADYYQGRLEDILLLSVQNDAQGKSSAMPVRAYHNDISEPMPDDQVTAIRYLAETDFAFYKGDLSQAELVEAKRKENGKICHVFMGIFFGVSALMYLISRAEDKLRQKVIIVDAHGD